MKGILNKKINIKEQQKIKKLCNTLKSSNIITEPSWFCCEFVSYKNRFDEILNILDENKEYVQFCHNNTEDVFNDKIFHVIKQHITALLNNNIQVLFLGHIWDAGFFYVRVLSYYNFWDFLKLNGYDSWMLSSDSMESGLCMWRYEYYYRIYIW